jgi:tyrosyl-tRNA synthetase
LADEVTRLVHGEEGLAAAQRITQALFVGAAYTLGSDDLEQLALDGLPTTPLKAGEIAPTLTQLLSDVGMVTSGKQVKDALKNKAVFINGIPVEGEPPIDTATCFRPDNALHEQYWIVRLGKKKYHLFTAA